MKTTEKGRRAEQAAKVYLEMRGFEIIEQNFRRPRCEIDIIAKKNKVVHLIEVKYRATDDQGGGLEAITKTKMRQMQFAAEIWVQEVKYEGAYTLSAIEIAGDNYAVMSFIEDVL